MTCEHGYHAMGAFTAVSLAEVPQLAFIFVSWSGDQIQDFMLTRQVSYRQDTPLTPNFLMKSSVET